VGLVGAAAAAADGVRANIINEKNKLSMVDLLGFWIARLFSTGFTLVCARFQKPGPTSLAARAFEKPSYFAAQNSEKAETAFRKGLNRQPTSDEQ